MQQPCFVSRIHDLLRSHLSQRPLSLRAVSNRVPAVVKMRAQEMLDYLGYGNVTDYHQVCPGRTKPTVRESYLNFVNRTPSARDRRDRAIACALLRQRKQHAFFKDAHTERHDHPISLAYAIATAASKDVVRRGQPTNRNWTIADWLMLKGGLIKASEHNIRAAND